MPTGAAAVPGTLETWHSPDHATSSGRGSQQAAQVAVVVVDRCPALGAGLVEVLRAEGFLVTRSAVPVSRMRPGDAGAALVTVGHDDADWTTMSELRRRFPDLALIAVLLGNEPPDHLRALRSGASAAINMRADPAQLAAAIRAALAGLTVLPIRMAHTVAAQAAAHAAPGRLSEDDVRWLRALGRGRSVVELACVEGYSQREAFRRLARLYRRMGARNRQEAIALAAQWGVLVPEACDLPA